MSLEVPATPWNLGTPLNWGTPKNITFRAPMSLDTLLEMILAPLLLLASPNNPSSHKNEK